TGAGGGAPAESQASTRAVPPGRPDRCPARTPARAILSPAVLANPAPVPADAALPVGRGQSAAWAPTPHGAGSARCTPPATAPTTGARENRPSPAATLSIPPTGPRAQHLLPQRLSTLRPARSAAPPPAHAASRHECPGEIPGSPCPAARRADTSAQLRTPRAKSPRR